MGDTTEQVASDSIQSSSFALVAGTILRELVELVDSGRTTIPLRIEEFVRGVVVHVQTNVSGVQVSDGSEHALECRGTSRNIYRVRSSSVVQVTTVRQSENVNTLRGSVDGKFTIGVTVGTVEADDLTTIDIRRRVNGLDHEPVRDTVSRRGVHTFGDVVHIRGGVDVRRSRAVHKVGDSQSVRSVGRDETLRAFGHVTENVPSPLVRGPAGAGVHEGRCRSTGCGTVEATLVPPVVRDDSTVLDDTDFDRGVTIVGDTVPALSTGSLRNRTIVQVFNCGCINVVSVDQCDNVIGRAVRRSVTGDVQKIIAGSSRVVRKILKRPVQFDNCSVRGGCSVVVITDITDVTVKCDRPVSCYESHVLFSIEIRLSVLCL